MASWEIPRNGHLDGKGIELWDLLLSSLIPSEILLKSLKSPAKISQTGADRIHLLLHWHLHLYRCIGDLCPIPCLQPQEGYSQNEKPQWTSRGYAANFEARIRED